MDNLNKKSDAVAFQLDAKTLCKVYELAQAKGKKPGDSVEEEIMEVMRANPDKITPINTVDDLKKKTDSKKILDLRKKDDADATDDA